MDKIEQKNTLIYEEVAMKQGYKKGLGFVIGLAIIGLLIWFMKFIDKFIG